MTQYRCIIVDDEELARELIEAHLGQLDNFTVLASCASALEASAILNEEHVDLMFLDIEMPVLKGTDFYKNLVNKPQVIFTTAYRDYAIDGFDLDAVDYLLKPITFARFFKAIERFLKSQRSFEPPKSNASEARLTMQTSGVEKTSIFVRKDRKRIKIDLSEVVYVQSLKDYVQIFLEHDSHIVKAGISAFETELGAGFLRVHRSYIVNKDKVTAVTHSDLELKSIEIPIGENYKAQVLAAFDT